jgi:hypothetical protein
MDDLVPRLPLWAQEHPVRAWICIVLLVFLVIVLVSIATGGTPEPGVVANSLT